MRHHMVRFTRHFPFRLFSYRVKKSVTMRLRVTEDPILERSQIIISHSYKAAGFSLYTLTETWKDLRTVKAWKGSFAMATYILYQ